MEEIFVRTLVLAVVCMLPLTSCEKPQESAAEVSDSVDDTTGEIMSEEEEDEATEDEEGQTDESEEEDRPAEDDGEDNTATGDEQ